MATMEWRELVDCGMLASKQNVEIAAIQMRYSEAVVRDPKKWASCSNGMGIACCHDDPSNALGNRN